MLLPENVFKKSFGRLKGVSVNDLISERRRERRYVHKKQKMKSVIVIVGPTATGKTKLAIQIAKNIGGEIISADSRQIYKELNIGTNKSTKKQQKSAKHHLIDIVEINGNFSAGDFVKLANEKIKEIFERKKIPVIVGGTGLYIKAIIDGLIKVPKSNKRLRARLTELCKTQGLEFIYRKLEKIDPETARVIDRQNPRRVIRALEICYLTGRKFSELKKGMKKSKYNFIIFGVRPSKENLHRWINIRVDQMINRGLFDEVKKLAKRYSRNNQLLQTTIGYRETMDFLNGKISREKAIELIKRHTRQYAKRQLTFFKKDKRIIWIQVENLRKISYNNIVKVISEKIKYG